MKGPKAVLASAIATALDEFFVVDKHRIESNLLVDAMIKLTDIKVRERTIQLPNSVVTVFGCVDSVVFSWAWGQSKQGGWVKDAKLEIKCMAITARLSEEHDDTCKVEHPPEMIETIEQEAAQHVEEEQDTKHSGWIYGYIQKQVQMILDSLTLHIEDFSMTIELPKQQDQQVSVHVGGRSVELVSLGRLLVEGQEKHAESSGVLDQTLTLIGFYSHLQMNGETVPILGPFHYTAKAKRFGQRFTSIAKNLTVRGSSQNDLLIYVGPLQISALSKLGVLVMAPPGQSEENFQDAVSGYDTNAIEETAAPLAEAPSSSFTFQLSSCSLFIDNETTVKMPNAEFTYVMDGTKMSLTADSVNIDGAIKVQLKSIRANLVEPVTLDLDSIDTLFIPSVLELTQPSRNIKIVKENKSVSIDLDTVRATKLLSQRNDASSDSDSDSGTSPFPQLPLAFAVSVTLVELKDEGSGKTMGFENLNLYLNPRDQQSDVALTLDAFHHQLVDAKKICFFGSLPTSRANEIDDLKFDVESAKVSAGKSAEEWLAAFMPGATPPPKAKKSQVAQSKKQKSVPWKLPNAKVGPLKLVISWKGTGVSLDDVKISIKPYYGKDLTTSTDLINHYTKACLIRVPDFISNAEVLGLNLVDTSASTWGAFLNLASPVLGPLAGIAAIGAVDSVKGAIEKGKKSRQADEGAKTRPLDLFRGLAYSVDAATKQGAAVRGKTGGTANPLDFTLGSMVGTGRYVNENKTRLGAAGLGGAGMTVGAIFGGPVGAVVAGVVTQAVAGKTLEAAEQHMEKRKSKKKD